MTQPTLDFSSIVQDRARGLTTGFLEHLQDGQWHKGRELCAVLQTDERTLRQCADDAAGEVISGNQGYRLLKFASNTEIDHAEARLLSQARKMTERAAQYRKARNSGGRAA